jgi:hypothetical protein
MISFSGSLRIFLLVDRCDMLDGIFEPEQRGKQKSRLHRRNEPLMEAVSGIEDLRSSVIPYFATILINRKVST